MREGLASHHQWENIRCSDIIKDLGKDLPPTIITIDGNVSVEEACQILIEHAISSAPVWDTETKSYAGMFDYLDVASYVLLGMRKDINMEEESIEIQELLKQSQKHKSVPVKFAVDLSRRNPFCAVMTHTGLPQLVDTFSQGIHRVVVEDESGKPVAIMSQSTVVKYLSKHMSQFPPLRAIFDKTVHDVGFGSRQVIQVSQTTPVVEALKLMQSNNVTSLAVVSSSGSLFANLSMADIKWVVKSNFKLLWDTVGNLVRIPGSEIGITDGRDRYPVFDVTPKSQLSYVLNKVVATRAHRLWVVDPEKGNVPVSVISLTDIFKLLANIPSEEDA